MPRLATAPARVIIEVAFELFEGDAAGAEGLGVGISLQVGNVRTVPERASSPSSRASRRRLALAADLALRDRGLDEVFIAVKDGADRP